MTNLFDTFCLLQQFSSVKRYSRDRLVCPENDLEHTGFVALLAYFIAVKIETKLKIKIDYSKLLRGAITHDIDEALTGDIPRPTKHYNSEIGESVKKLEVKSVLTIFEFLAHEVESTNILEDWENSKGTTTLEQRIVRISDIMSVVYKVWVEVILLSNRSFLIVAEEVRPILKSHLRELKFKSNLNFDTKEIFEEIYVQAIEIIDTCISSSSSISSVIPNAIEIKK